MPDLDFTKYDAEVAKFRVSSPNIAKAFDENKVLLQQLAGTAPPPPPPPPEPYPASFFTGPLGSRNVVPNDPAGALLCAWGGVKGNNEQQQRDLYLAREAAMGRKYDGIQFQDGQLDVSGQKAEDWIASGGRLPIFAWNTYTSPASILSGADNAKIDALIARLKPKTYRVMVRLMHEFDLSHLPYFCGMTAASAAQWVSAWRYIVDRFKAAGVTNVGFWWCPTEQGGGLRPIINQCYPGDTYVDWVGTDVYNNVGSWSTPLHEGWAEFRELVDYGTMGGPQSTMGQFGTRKPFVVGETGCRFGDGRPGASPTPSKADWHRNIDVTKSPLLRGVCFFDVNTGSDEWNNWRVDSSQTYAQMLAQNLGGTDAGAFQGFKDLAAKARWKTGVRA